MSRANVQIFLGSYETLSTLGPIREAEIVIEIMRGIFRLRGNAGIPGKRTVTVDVEAPREICRLLEEERALILRLCKAEIMMGNWKWRAE